MRKKVLVSFLIGIFCLGFLTPTGLRASYTLNLEGLFQSTTLNELIERLVDLIFTVSIVLVPLIIVLAAFLLVTAAGNPEKIAQAKKIIIWSLIGFLIVLFSKGITSLISSLFKS